jgi:hypothetical protein
MAGAGPGGASNQPRHLMFKAGACVEVCHEQRHNQDRRLHIYVHRDTI